MSTVAMVLVAVLGYLVVAIGIMRPTYLHQYKALRKKLINHQEMPISDAKREAAKLAAQFAFGWPALLAVGAIIVPLWVLFDGLPMVAKATGNAVANGAKSAGFTPATPLVNWVSAPVEREIKREEHLALEARASAPDEEPPLIPDEIKSWTPPKGGAGVARTADGFTDVPIVFSDGFDPHEHARIRAEQNRRRIERNRARSRDYVIFEEER